MSELKPKPESLGAKIIKFPTSSEKTPLTIDPEKKREYLADIWKYDNAITELEENLILLNDAVRAIETSKSKKEQANIWAKLRGILARRKTETNDTEILPTDNPNDPAYFQEAIKDYSIEIERLIEDRNELFVKLPLEDREELEGSMRDLRKTRQLTGHFLYSDGNENNTESTPEFNQEGVILEIKNAKNPYREAMIDGGVSRKTIPETKDISLNLTEHLQNDIARYESAGLSGWATDLRKIENKLKTLSPEKRKIIEQEIQAGAIPIFMPGREAQAQSQIAEIANKLKPYWRKDNQPEQVNDAYIWDYIVSLGEKLTEDAPKNPYILLTQPTQKPPAETVNKTVAQQLAALKKINKARKKEGQAPAQAMAPYEYIVLQEKFTGRLANTDKGKFGKSGLREIKPLDFKTYTRFISLPPSSGGSAPNGYFHPDSDCRQLRLGGSSAGDADPVSGFRLSVRVEI